MASKPTFSYTTLMPEIEIQIDRPYLTLALVGVILAGIVYSTAGTNAQAPIGGDPDQQNPSMVASTAEADMAHIRERQQVLSLREQILRGQLALLQKQQDNGQQVDEQAFMDTRDQLIALLQDKAAAEKKIVESLHEFWAADGYAYDASKNGTNKNSVVRFYWPVQPLEGISAHFDDASYEQHFGMPHHAIDIPTPQGTVIGAAADGVVTKVSDQGMGFSSLVISHNGGMATLYGHVSGFLVKEGDHVKAGDPVALSGGTPGTKGAGLMTTGAHLHLAFYKDGVVVDPELYLPKR
jgi:murein DD-endopeptidase MepM/ murein hydrolase activator NlpD